MKAFWLIILFLSGTSLVYAQTGAWPYSEKLDSSSVPIRIRKVMHGFVRKPNNVMWRRKFGEKNITHSFTAYFQEKIQNSWMQKKSWINISPKGSVLSFQHPVALYSCPAVVQHAVSSRIKAIKRAPDRITIRILGWRIADETGYSITYHGEANGKTWEMFDEFYFDKNGKEEK